MEERLELFEDDATVHLLQLSYLQILNFLEKIIETELSILEGTAHPPSQDPLAVHGAAIQARAIMEEQRQILK